MTGRDLISASLRLIGALAPGESLAAQEATDGLASINRMISSWSTESLMIYAKVRDSLTLTANDGEYTISSTGDLVTSRPTQITEAAIRDESVSPALEFPISILTLAEWQAIVSKGSTSQYPTHLFADGGYPSQTIRLWPIPTAANKLVLWSDKVLTAISTLDTSLSFPPGYERAMVYNGALELAPEYGRAVSDLVVAIAQDSKAAIKRANMRPVMMTPDAIPAGGGSRFNIYTGESG